MAQMSASPPIVFSFRGGLASLLLVFLLTGCATKKSAAIPNSENDMPHPGQTIQDPFLGALGVAENLIALSIHASSDNHSKFVTGSCRVRQARTDKYPTARCLKSYLVVYRANESEKIWLDESFFSFPIGTNEKVEVRAFDTRLDLQSPRKTIVGPGVIDIEISQTGGH